MNIYPKEPKVHSKIIEILNNSDLAIRNEALEVLLDIEPTDQSILESIKKLKSKYPEDAEFQDKINRILSRNK